MRSCRIDHRRWGVCLVCVGVGEGFGFGEDEVDIEQVNDNQDK